MKIKNNDILTFMGRLESAILLFNERTKKREVVFYHNNSLLREGDKFKVELFKNGVIWLINDDVKLKVVEEWKQTNNLKGKY